VTDYDRFGILLMWLTGIVLLVFLAIVATNQPPMCLVDTSSVPEVVRPANPSAGAPQGPTLRTLFDALWMQEAGQRLDPPDGDGGKAIGPYQIWRAYWIDARMPYGTYQDCRGKAYAEQVMARYWRRYCPAAREALDTETLARTHHGGPRGATSRRAVTDGYWASVKRIVEER